MENAQDLNLGFSVKEEMISKGEEFCRLCVGKTSEYSSVFEENLHESLKDCLGLSILETDNWPKFLCRKCLATAKECVAFILTIRESERTLQNLYGDWREIEIKPDIEMVDVKELPMLSVEIKIENDEELDEGGKKRKKISDEGPRRKRGRPRKHSESPERPEPEPISPDSTDEDDIPLENLRKQRSKRESYKKSAEDLRRIEEFYKMDCILCQQSFENLYKLRMHYRGEHKKKGFVVCCNVKLNRQARMLQHIDFHLNPDTFKCSECGKTFKNKIGLDLHRVNSHTPQELHKYKCPKCPKTFMSRPRLRNHSLVHVTAEEKNHICPHCSKAFPAKPNLMSHIRQIHQDFIYHVCEICAKMFKSRDALVNHQKTHTGEKIEKLPCPTCGKSYSEVRMKAHMKLHSESGQVFKCHLCDRESASSSALRQHIKFVHIGERKHKCNLCSSAFKRPIDLREHMATHTSHQILYTCLFCPKQFNSNANKYVHQKRQHPEEYQAMKLKREEKASK